MSEHHPKQLHLAIIGFGKLGKACAEAIRDTTDMQLAGVVRRPESVRPLPDPFRRIPCVAHISELGQIDVALVCVPAEEVLGVAHDLLQHRIPLVECASFEDERFEAHREEINRAALHHRVAAVVGAGWSHGAVARLQNLFEMLIPRGQTTLTKRPGVKLHHTAAAENIKGVKGALCSELRTAAGELQRYVYVELHQGADFGEVSLAIESDPLFAGEKTYVFEVESIAALEEEGHGILIERRGTADAGLHDSLLLEARFDSAAFAARIMLDAACGLPQRHPGAHVYSLPA